MKRAIYRRCMMVGIVGLIAASPVFGSDEADGGTGITHWNFPAAVRDPLEADGVGGIPTSSERGAEANDGTPMYDSPDASTRENRDAGRTQSDRESSEEEGLYRDAQ